MSMTTSKLPLSQANTILVGSTFVAAVITALLGNIPATGVLLILSVGGLIFALLARRPKASDWLRINSIEYRDERDRRLAMNGFAAVGIVALILALVAVVAAALYAGFVGQTPMAIAFQAAAAAQFFALAVAWGWANTVVIKRG
ncbi:MAG: hypothetical protein ACKVOG_00945 [Rhodoglobus sp.]